MEQNTLKVTSVLADPTRFSIYQYVAKQHREVTVQEVAEVFDIHVNVARLHLTKLESVSLLASETKKTGKVEDQAVVIIFRIKVFTYSFHFGIITGWLSWRWSLWLRLEKKGSLH